MPGKTIIELLDEAIRENDAALRELKKFNDAPSYEELDSFSEASLRAYETRTRLQELTAMALDGGFTRQEIYAQLPEQARVDFVSRQLRYWDNNRKSVSDKAYEQARKDWEDRGDVLSPESWQAMDPLNKEPYYNAYLEDTDRDFVWDKVILTQYRQNPSTALSLLGSVYQALKPERRQKLDEAAQKLLSPLPDAERKAYPLRREIADLQSKIDNDGTLTPEEKEARRKALSGADELTAYLSDREAKRNESREDVISHINLRRSEAVFAKNAKKDENWDRIAYLPAQEDGVRPSRGTGPADVPAKPPISQAYRNALVGMLRRMREMKLLAPEDVPTEEESKKEYGFRKLRAARTAYMDAIRAGNSAELPQLREDFDRELGNARELMEMARSSFGRKPWSIPSNQNLERNNHEHPFEIMKDQRAVCQVNGVYQLLVVMHRLGLTDPAEFVDNLGTHLMDLGRRLTEKVRMDQMLTGYHSDYLEVGRLLTSTGTERMKRYGVDPDRVAMDFLMNRWRDGLVAMAPESENTEALQDFADNAAAAIADMRGRQAAKLGFLTRIRPDDVTEDEWRRQRSENMQRLLMVRDADMEKIGPDAVFDPPGVGKDGKLEEQFSLDRYLENTPLDAFTFVDRVRALTKFAENTDTTGKRDVLEAANRACERALTAHQRLLDPEPEKRQLPVQGVEALKPYVRMEKARRWVQRDMAALELEESRKALENAGQVLEEATRGVWFGSKEFDAVLKAVRTAGEKQRNISARDDTEPALGNYDVLELRDGYQAAMEAARIYLSKKEKEGTLNANGRRRVEAMRQVLKTLETGEKSLEGAQRFARGELDTVLERGRALLEKHAESPEKNVIAKSLEHVGDVLTKQRTVNPEDKVDLERDLAVVMTLLNGAPRGANNPKTVLEQSDRLLRSGGIRRETGDLSPEACERMLLENRSAMSRFYDSLYFESLNVVVASKASGGMAELEAMRRAVKGRQGNERECFAELLRHGKRLVALAELPRRPMPAADPNAAKKPKNVKQRFVSTEEEIKVSPERMQQIVENDGFRMAMSRLAANPKLLDRMFSGTAEEVSSRMLDLSNQGGKMYVMHSAMNKLKAAGNEKDAGRRFAAIYENLSYILAADKAARDTAVGEDHRLHELPDRESIEAHQEMLQNSAAFKSMAYELAAGPADALNRIVKDAQMGGSVRTAAELLNAAGNSERMQAQSKAADALLAAQKQNSERQRDASQQSGRKNVKN